MSIEYIGKLLLRFGPVVWEIMLPEEDKNIKFKKETWVPNCKWRFCWSSKLTLGTVGNILGNNGYW